MSRFMFMACIAALPFATSLNAQRPGPQPLPVASMPQWGNGSSATTRVPRAITIDLRDVSVGEALESIAAASGLRIAYSRDLLPLNAMRTSVRVQNASVDDALRIALRETGIMAQVSADGETIMVAPAERRREDGIVRGKVRHAKTNEPLRGASVSIDDAQKGVTTQEDGSFQITGVTPGTHRIVVRLLGYGKAIQTVQVTDGQTISVDVVLTPSASTLDEVVVTGTVVATARKAIPTPITVITAKDIEQRGISRVDELFRGEVPGLLALDAGTMRYSSSAMGGMQTSTLYSRGSASLDAGTNPIKTYVDGVELLDPSYLGTIDPKSIERIEIITGPQAATIYGSGAMGGVMQIFTKRGSGAIGVDGTLSLKYGMLQSNLSNGYTPSHNHSLSVTGGVGSAFSYAANGSYLYTGQWQPGLFARTYGASVGATYSAGRATASGSIAITQGTNGTAGRGGTFNNSMMPGSSVSYTSLLDKVYRENGLQSPSQSTALYLSRQLSQSVAQTASLNIDHRTTSYWQHHLTVGRSQTRFALDPVAPNNAILSDTLFQENGSNGERTTASYNTTLSGHLTPMITSSLTLGANMSSVDQLQYSACLATGTSTSYVPCSSSTPISLSKARREDSWGGFGSWQVGLLDRLFLTYGLRAERNPSYGRDHRIDWTPTVGGTYTAEIGELTFKVLGSFGRATRPPQLAQRLSVITQLPGYEPSQYLSQAASPNLTPEYSRGPQTGLELYYGNRGSLTVNHYRQTIDNLIQPLPIDSITYCRIGTTTCVNTATYQYQNVAQIVQRGWEQTLSLNLADFTVKGTYSWNTSKITKAFTGITIAGIVDPSIMSRVPSHTGNVTVAYARGRTGVSLVTNYIGESWRSGATTDVAEYIRRTARLRMYLDRMGNQSWYRRGDYVKSDLAVTQRLNGRVTGTVNVTNLGNNVTSDFGEMFPTLGRQTLIGLSVRTR